MKLILIFFTLIISFQSSATMCGPPNSIETVRKGSSAYRVTYSGITEVGTRDFKMEELSRVWTRPYRQLHFDVIETLLGRSKSEIYVIYYLDAGLGNYKANPPDHRNTQYLLSFNLNDFADGSFERPFVNDPCDLQKRI